ncbi:hypothetical protein [Marmoricola sp. RAF53]|uniref:hypothetical protein n=1 Tax=Marmoricola sp. RAF53 TaxID=3233059 RepID=UPI003F9DCE3A
MPEDTVVLEQPAPPPPAAPAAAPTGSSSFGRSVAVVVLLVLSAVLTTPALVAYWGQRTINDSQRYIDTTGPLIASPEVQKAVATKVTQAIQEQVDVEALLNDAFSGVIADRPRLQLLVGPISGAVNGLIESQVNQFIASDAFEQIWTRVNIRTQQLLVALLNGDDTGPVTISAGEVVLDVTQIIDAVQAELVNRGLTFADRVPIPDKDRQIVLLDSDSLNQAQNIWAFTNPVAKWLLWVVLVMLLGAVLVSVRKARTTVWVGAILLANGLLVGLTLQIGRQFFVNQLSGTVFGPASKIFYDTLLTYLHRGGQALVLLGFLVILSGWYAGRTASARATRGFLCNGLETVGASVAIPQVRSVGKWVAANAAWLRGVIVALSFVVLFWGNQVNRERLFWCFVLMLVLLAVAQVLVGAGRAPDEPEDAAAPTGTEPAPA